MPFPELGKADTRSGKGTGSTACEAAPERLFRAAEKAARRTQRHNVPSQCNATTPSCWPVAAHPPPDVARLLICPATCAVRFVGHAPMAAIAGLPFRPTKRSGAAHHERLIRGLPPSACLPFQARGKAPDQSLECSVCLPFPGPGQVPGANAPTVSSRSGRGRGRQVNSNSMMRS